MGTLLSYLDYILVIVRCVCPAPKITVIILITSFHHNFVKKNNKQTQYI